MLTGVLSGSLVLLSFCGGRKAFEKSKGSGALGGLIYNLMVKTVVRCLQKSSFGLKVRYFETQTSRQLQVPAAVCVMQGLETIPRNKFPFYLFSDAYIENLQYTVLAMLSIPS